jgi:outer membrane lipoprotein SlyB
MRKLLLVLLLSGCATGSHHPGTQNPVKEVIKFGVIESIATIEMDSSSNAGSMAGGIFGQVGGASSGAGRGSIVGSIFGGVLGGTMGQQAGISARPGLEIWVKLDGEEQSSYVMQAGKADTFRVGDRVRIVNKKGKNMVEADTARQP